MSSVLNMLSGIYLILVIILDLAGNSFVLYATISHNAIKLDRMCIWIIQNLAVVDIANGIFVIIPAAVTFLNNGHWTLGTFFCRLHFIYKYSFLVGNVFLINFLSLNKIIRCVFPLRALNSSPRQRKFVTVLSIIPMLVGPARKIFAVYIIETAKVRFSPAHGMCLAYEIVEGVEQHFQANAMRITCVVLIILPCLALIIMNFSLVIIAVRATKRKLKIGNILTVVVVTLVFIISFSPFVLQYFRYGEEFSNASKDVRFGQLASVVSSFCNPMIYLATNDNFRIFTKLSMERVLSNGISFCGKGWRRTKEKIESMMSSIQKIFGSTRNPTTEGKEVTGVELEKDE